MKKILLAMMMSSFLLTACGGGDKEKPEDKEKSEKSEKKGKKKEAKKSPAEEKAERLAAEAARQAKLEAAEVAAHQQGVLVLGDYLSAAEGMASDQGWVGMLEKRLAKATPPLPVVNASLSGDTVSGGMGRVGWQINRYHPRVVVIALGARDFASQTPLADMGKQLQTIIQTVKAQQAQPVLVGFEPPEKADPEYRAQAKAMFEMLAQVHGIPLIPNLLAPQKRLNPDDPMAHGTPGVELQPALLEEVWPAIYTQIKAAGIQTNLPAPVVSEPAPIPVVAKPAAPPPAPAPLEEKK